MPDTPDQTDPVPEGTPEPFLVEQYELHVSTYRVITASAAEAIAKVLRGEAELVENSTEYVGVCDTIGMPIDGNEELANELSEMNVYVDEEKIPSIRSVLHEV